MAQVSHPLVGVGVAARSECQPEEADLEARARVPGKFKGEAGRAQSQRRGCGGGPLASKSREAWHIHLRGRGRGWVLKAQRGKRPRKLTTVMSCVRRAGSGLTTTVAGWGAA